MSWLLLLALTSALYSPDNWLAFPSMHDVRCIATSHNRLYVAVPQGVYILKRGSYRHLRTLTRADGLDGEVRVCAHNPARNELLVATAEHLYRYGSTADAAVELLAPFNEVRSIGISTTGAVFDTEKGLYAGRGADPGFRKLETLPDSLTWFGRRDSSGPRDYVFLAPYFITDPQLIQHDMTLVRRDPRSRRLYVATADYGVFVYDPTSGFTDHHIRFGPPPERVRRITRAGRETRFTSETWRTSVDDAGNWTYRRTRYGDIFAGADHLAAATLRDLDHREHVNVVAGNDGDRLYVGTGEALYSVEPDGRYERLLQLGQPVNAIALTGDTLLFGTDFGLYRFSDGDMIEVRDPFDRTGFGVYAIARAADGTDWFGTIGGILSRTPDGEWDYVVPPGFELGRPVSGLAAGDSVIFFRSIGGFTAWDLRSRSYVEYDEQSGLPSSNIDALHADDRHLWLSTPGFIVRFDYPKDLK